MSEHPPVVRTIPLTPQELEWCAIEKNQQRNHEWRRDVLGGFCIITLMLVVLAGFGFLMIMNWAGAEAERQDAWERYKWSHTPAPPCKR